MKAYTAIILLAACVAMLAACASAPASAPPASPLPAVSAAPSAASATAYKDGTYSVTCTSDGEGYCVQGTLTISGGKITSAEWGIYDRNREGKPFDKDYEAVFAGNDTYIQQCRDNLKGMQGYSSQLIETQDPDGVDAVSGATWAYHKFNQFVTEALKQASAK